MIPALVNGVLSEGIYVCTLTEVEDRFGRFQRSDRRVRLTEKLRELTDEARMSDIVAALVLDGSYVTAKEQPDDIDLIIALRTTFDLKSEMSNTTFNRNG